MTHEAGIKAATEVISAEHAYQLSYEAIEKGLQAYLSASGMVLVPREPTMEMLKAADNVSMSDEDMLVGPYEFDKAVYEVYLATAPNPFKSNPGE